MTKASSPREPSQRRRILFLSEAVTLAHVARPVALAQGLDPARYDITLGVDPRYNRLLGDLPYSVRPVHSIPAERFLAALAKGSPLYDAETLRGYVREDLRLLEETKPDVVIGDFRLSLAVSARVAKVPYAAVINAYWSPYARQRFPLPELPMTKVVGVRAAGILFGLVRPVGFAYHTLPLNRVRRDYGLPSLGWDLRRIYTEADHVLYADVPEMVPTFDLPANHHYLGPILWSPRVELPAWWNAVPPDRPQVYVTLGSSGRRDLLPTILEALAPLPVSVLAATAGQALPPSPPENAWIADYLPGEQAAQRAELVICNGGSLTTFQALTVGKPVVGIASNMDQHLNMGAVERCGVGRLVRSEVATVSTIRNVTVEVLASSRTKESAATLAKNLARYQAMEEFRRFLSTLV